MKEATEHLPKCLSKIDGKSLLDIQINTCKKAGVDEIALVTGYLSKYLNNYSDKTFHNEMWHQTNMVYSLFHAREWLQKYDCIVSYSDIFYDKSLIKDLIKSSHDINVAYDPNWRQLWEKRFDDPLADAETFRLFKDNLIIEIGNKTKNIDEIQGQYMGVMKFTPNGWRQIENTINSLPENEYKKIQLTQLLQKCILSGVKIHAVPNHFLWGEVDSKEDLEFYNLNKI